MEWYASKRFFFKEGKSNFPFLFFDDDSLIVSNLFLVIVASEKDSFLFFSLLIHPSHKQYAFLFQGTCCGCAGWRKETVDGATNKANIRKWLDRGPAGDEKSDSSFLCRASDGACYADKESRLVIWKHNGSGSRIIRREQCQPMRYATHMNFNFLFAADVIDPKHSDESLGRRKASMPTSCDPFR